MAPRFSLAHLTVLGTTPLELLEIAAGAGYDYASIRTTPVAQGEVVTPLVGDPAMIRQVLRRVADTGVQVLDVELARLRPHDEPDDYGDHDRGSHTQRDRHGEPARGRRDDRSGSRVGRR